jgi:hypothetical protein
MEEQTDVKAPENVIGPKLVPLASWERRETCRHEAGHAIAALRLGLSDDFRAVVLDRPDARGFSGWVKPKGTKIPKSERPSRREIARICNSPEYDFAIRDQITRTAILYLAGVGAQFHKNRGMSQNLYVASVEDRRNLVSFARRFGRLVTDFWPWWDQACRFVDSHWGQITAVAGALDEKGSLDAAEVLEIANEAPAAVNERPPWDPRDPGRHRLAVSAAKWRLEVAPADMMPRCGSFPATLPAGERGARGQTSHSPSKGPLSSTTGGRPQ